MFSRRVLTLVYLGSYFLILASITRNTRGVGGWEENLETETETSTKTVRRRGRGEVKVRGKVSTWFCHGRTSHKKADPHSRVLSLLLRETKTYFCDYLIQIQTGSYSLVMKAKLAEDNRRVRWALNACIPSQAPEIGHVSCV